MLGSKQRIRFVGLRYGVVLACLAAAAAILLNLLFVNFPRVGAPVEARPNWTKMTVILSFLIATATAAVLTVYSYFLTSAKLARIQTTAKAILGSLVGGVLTLDTEGRVTIINRAASRILEISTSPPYPELGEFSHKHEALVGLIRRSLDRRQYVQEQDSVFVNSRNEQVTLRTSISEYVDVLGQRAGIVVLVKDVSKLIAMESELRKRDRLAARPVHWRPE